jgi:hypothetical protein
MIFKSPPILGGDFCLVSFYFQAPSINMEGAFVFIAMRSGQFTAKNQANIRSKNYFCFLNFNP